MGEIDDIKASYAVQRAAANRRYRQDVRTNRGQKGYANYLRRRNQSYQRELNSISESERSALFIARGGTREQFVQNRRANLDAQGRAKRNRAIKQIQQNTRDKDGRLPEEARRLRNQELRRQGTQSLQEQKDYIKFGDKPKQQEALRQKITSRLFREQALSKARRQTALRVGIASNLTQAQNTRAANQENARVGAINAALNAKPAPTHNTTSVLVRKKSEEQEAKDLQGGGLLLNPAHAVNRRVLDKKNTFGSLQRGFINLNRKYGKKNKFGALERYETQFFGKVQLAANNPTARKRLIPHDPLNIYRKDTLGIAAAVPSAAVGAKQTIVEKPVTAGVIFAAAAATGGVAAAYAPAAGVGAVALKGAAVVGVSAYAAGSTAKAVSASRAAGGGLAGSRAAGRSVGGDAALFAVGVAGAVTGVGVVRGVQTLRPPKTSLKTKIRGNERYVTQETKGTLKGSAYEETAISNPRTGTTVSKGTFTKGKLKGLQVDRVVTPKTTTQKISAPKVFSKGLKVIQQTTTPTPKSYFAKLSPSQVRTSNKIISSVTSETAGQARSVGKIKAQFNIKGVGTRTSTRITKSGGELSLKQVSTARTRATGEFTSIKQTTKIKGFGTTKSAFIETKRPEFVLDKVDLQKDFFGVKTDKTANVLRVTSVKTTAPRVVSTTALQQNIKGQYSYVDKSRPLFRGKRGALLSPIQDSGLKTQTIIGSSTRTTKIGVPKVPLSAPKFSLSRPAFNFGSTAADVGLGASVASVFAAKPVTASRSRLTPLSAVTPSQRISPVIDTVQAQVPSQVQAQVPAVVQTQAPLITTFSTSTVAAGALAPPPIIAGLGLLPIAPPLAFRDFSSVRTPSRRGSFVPQQGRGYAPTLTANVFGITGKRSRLGEFTGLGIRPMLKKKGKKRATRNK